MYYLESSEPYNILQIEIKTKQKTLSNLNMHKQYATN